MKFYRAVAVAYAVIAFAVTVSAVLGGTPEKSARWT